ncbi:branched-chain amino acid ABC transporter permease [Methylobacterium sp. P31]
MLASNPSRPALAAPRAIALVAATEVAGALFLRQFLLVEDWRLVVALLILFGAGLVAMQRRPALEARLEDAFADQGRFAAGLGVVIVLAFPFVLEKSTYALHLLVIGQLYAVLALALNFQLGSANIPNFATGASYGIGAYASALLALNWDVSFWLALPAAAVVATIFGFLLGVPSMRTRDSYLALVTIAFGVVINQLLNNFEFTGGPNGLVGIPVPELFGHSFASPLVVFGYDLPSQANFYYLSALLVGIAIVFARRVHDSRVGLAWNALRADEARRTLPGHQPDMVQGPGFRRRRVPRRFRRHHLRLLRRLHLAR